MLLRLYNLRFMGCLLLLSNFFNQANCCEEAQTASSYMLATGHTGKERLDKIHEAYGSLSPLESFPPLPEHAKILSVGCGTGVRECQMAQCWPHMHITAVDNSEDQLTVARERASDLWLTNIDFILGDANNLSYIKGYDLVYARLLLIHVKNPELVLKGIVSAAKPGAPIICEEISSSSFFYEPYNKFYEQALQLTQEVAHKMGVDYDIGIKLKVIMESLGCKNVTLHQYQPDRTDENVKMQLQLALTEAKPKLILAGFDEQRLDVLLQGLDEFAKE